MATYIFPPSAELTEIAQVKQARLTQDRLIFRFMPIKTHDTSTVMWEQKDDYKGLQQLRGLGGQPASVAHTGGKRYIERPGYYGEFEPLDEQLLTERRQWGTWGTSINLNDLVMEAQDKLLLRRLDRIEWIGWKLFTTGAFSVLLPTGAIGHAGSYTLQSHNASTWSDHANSTPLADYRAVQLLSRGTSASFGSGATSVMNRTQVNHLLSNTNPNDLGGKRMAGLAQALSLADVNTLLLGEGLPRIEVYDEGYIDDAGVFQLFIPDGVVTVFGQHPAGQSIAEYMMTRNINNPGFAPGAYMEVIQEPKPPKEIQVHDGHNGGPALYYPGSVVKMDVS